MMKMVYKPFCLMFAFTISNTASQNLTVTPNCIAHRTTVQLTCETTDFASAVLFYLNGANKGGCTTSSCGTSISGYNTPTRSGTSTEMTIRKYNDSRDGGDWTCSYGVSTSSPYTVKLGNCETTTDGLSSGRVAAIAVSCCVIVIVIVIVIICYFRPRVPKPVPKVYVSICLYEFPNGYMVVLLVGVQSVTTVTNISWQKKVGNKFIPIQLDLNSFKYIGSSPEEPSLTILNVCPDDSGVYQCLATNRYGTGRSTNTVTLSVTAKAQEYEAPVGSKVDLLSHLCDLKNVQSVKWEHSGQQLPIFEDLMYKGGFSKHPSLTIRWVSLEDIGLWRCFMETKTSKHVIDVQLKIKEQHIESIAASNVKLLPGSFEIETKIIKTVTWKHDGKLFTTDGHLDDNPLCHAITLACLEDAGKWHCKIELTNLQIKTYEVRLTVKEKYMEAKVGSKVELLPELCDINDIEKVEWQHNNKAPDKPSNFKEDGRPSYTIEKAVYENSGTWLCILQFKNSKKSKKTFSVLLNVKGKADYSLPQIRGLPTTELLTESFLTL